MAPEVVKNPLKDHPDDFKNEARFHYNAVVDSWAVGCLAYELIVGFPPFMAETQQQVVKNINSLEVKYPKKMSEECVEFVKAALQRNPEDRATSHELIKHPWISLHMVSSSGSQPRGIRMLHSSFCTVSNSSPCQCCMLYDKVP
jgi:serine/threonine protein kinase